MFGTPLLNNVLGFYHVQLQRRSDCWVLCQYSPLAKLDRCYSIVPGRVAPSCSVVRDVTGPRALHVVSPRDMREVLTSTPSAHLSAVTV